MQLAETLNCLLLMSVLESTLFKRESSFLPLSNLNSTIVTYSQLVKNDLMKICENVFPSKSNPPEAELKHYMNGKKKMAPLLKRVIKEGLQLL